MNSLLYYGPLFLRGAGVTVAAWLIAGSVSIIVGTAGGIVGSARVGSPLMRLCVRLYAFVTKGIPAYVQILIFYFIIPSLVGVHVSAFATATFALALCSSGYVAEIVRAGLNAIPAGQWDAAFVLGYTLPQAVRRIIMPQLFRTILPALIGELEQLLKSTSLLATIGVTEVTRVGMNIISRELAPLPIYGAIALIYLFFSALLTLLMWYIERRMAYGYRY